MARIPKKVLSVFVSLALVLSALPVPALAQMAEEAMGEEPAASKPVAQDPAAPKPVVEPESDTASPADEAGEMGEEQIDPNAGSNPDAPEEKPDLESGSDSSMGTLPNQDDKQPGDANGPRNAFGFVPNPPVKSIHDENETPGLSTQESFPSSYSSVSYGYITPVRDQGSFGTCWSHAAMAMSEAYTLKHNLLPGQSSSWLDFSERHFAYYTYNTPPDPLGNMGADSVRVDPTTYFNGDFYDEYYSYLNYGGNCTRGDWSCVRVDSTL